MDNKYFTSLNGYLVKDTDARNGVSEVNAKLNATNTSVNNNKTNIATNTKDIATLKTSVTNVNAKADFNTANLESLQSSVNVVKIDNDKNKTDLSLLNEKVNGIDGINAQLETTIERVTTNEENISTNTANIQNIQMGLNAIHTHDNKATLDMITPANIEKWNGTISPEEVYSTEEVKTNKKWIDGKPLYRKVYKFTGITGASHEFSVSDLNIETVLIDLAHSSFTRITVHTGSVYTLHFGNYGGDGDSARLYYCKKSDNSSSIMAQFGSVYDGSEKEIIVTLEYTKR